MLERELSRWRSLQVDPPAEWRGAWVVVHEEDPPAPCESLAEAFAAHATLFGSTPALIRRLPGGGDGAPAGLALGDGRARLAAEFSCPRATGRVLRREARIDFDALAATLDLAAVVALELPVVDVADDGAPVYGAFMALSATGRRDGASEAVRLPALLASSQGPPGAVLGRRFLALNRARLADDGRRLVFRLRPTAS